MKHRALLLIIVILVSVYAVKGLARFNDSDKTDALANINEIAALATQDADDAPSSAGDDSPRPTQHVRELVSEHASVAQDDREIPSDVCSSVGAEIAYVRDLTTGSLLYERNVSRRWPLASVSKLMTAVISMEIYDPSSLVTIRDEDIRDSEGFSTFSSGTTLSVNDMVRSLLVASSNDAAFALMHSVGDEAFVDKMNAKAVELGMSQTTFYEPSGLSYLNQSTAADQYLLMRYIQTTHPYLLESTRLKTITVQDYGQKKKKTVANIDLFAGRKDFLGGKTGYIDQSGGNLVTIFRVGGSDVFVSVLGSADRFGEIEKLLSCAVRHSEIASKPSSE